MKSLLLLTLVLGAATAQFSPFSGAFPFRPFTGFGSSSGLYGSSPFSAAASTSHPYYGASPYGQGPSAGPYASSPYTTSFSSQPQYSASLGSPHTMSKDPSTASANIQPASPSVYDRIPGMGGGLISNFFNRNRRPSFFSGFRRGHPTPESQHSGHRPLKAPTAANFLYHPLPESYPYPPPPPPPYPYPNPPPYAAPSDNHNDHPSYDHEPDNNNPPPGRSPEHYPY